MDLTKVASSLRLNIVQQKARTFIFAVAKHPPINLSVTEATRNKLQIADVAILKQSVASARRPQPLNLTVMGWRERGQGDCCTDKCKKHVGLRVPGIALRAQELVGTLAERDCNAPLDEFVSCADGEDNAND